MAAQGSITLNTKVYTPRGTSNGISTWALVGDSTFGGATSLLTQSVRGPSKDGIFRNRYTLSVPKAATADSTCACTGEQLGENFADIQIRVHQGMTLAERQDFVDRLQAFVASAVFDASVAQLEPAWS